jgi:CBS-domain-containing membrane protein
MTASSGIPPSTRIAARAILTTPAVCDEEGPIMIGPIISKTLLLFAITGLTPKMMLVQKPLQNYCFFCIQTLLPNKNRSKTQMWDP